MPDSTDNIYVSQAKFDQLEERLRGTENALATLTSNIEINTNNLKENIAHTHVELGHRIDSLKIDMRENQSNVSRSVDSLKDSLQSLYVSHSGAQSSVKFNEKLIWGVVGLILTIGLYLIQDFIKVLGAG
jgi:chromosome segregation ATPase